MSNYDRLVHVDKENNVIIKTSLKDEIQAIFNKYSSYAICEKIIFKFHSNGNESRHSLIHKKTGDKRPEMCSHATVAFPFWNFFCN